MKPPILNERAIDLLHIHPVNNLWNYKAWIKVGCEVQIDTDLRWFIEWGNQTCFNSVHLGYHEAKRKCPECWQELEKEVDDDHRRSY